MIRGAIFDMDGTLLDSMVIWRTIGGDYLRSLGITPREELGETFKTFTLEQIAVYYRTHYGVTLSVQEIMDGVNRMVETFYLEQTQLRPGVREFLEALRDAGVSMAVATATDRYLAEAALRRCGVRSFFREIFTCTEVGCGKDRPDIYEAARRRLGTGLEETWVIEDAFHAAETAAGAGFPVLGICDPSESEQEGLKRLSRAYLTEFTETGPFWAAADIASIASDREKESNHMNMNTAVTIAGSDSSGGAGIQADLKTMTMNGVFAMSAITALTAQNTTGVRSIMEVTPEFLGEQIDAIFEDIRPDAVKIGMVASVGLIETISERLRFYRACNIVVDPVMVATSGARLISPDAVETLKECLLPMATVVTPNIPEAEILSGMEIRNEEEMVQAARIISETYRCAVLCKGGHSVNDANDLLWADGQAHWFYGKRIDNPNTHGTGCTLSSAIASNLAKGYDLTASVQRAKDYISGALAAMLDLGHGSGPMDHAFDLRGEFSHRAE